MKGSSPAAELVDPVFVRRRNPFRDRKLFLGVPRGNAHRETPEHNPVSIRRRRRYEVAAMLRAAALFVRLPRVFGRRRGESPLRESRKSAECCGQGHGDCAVDGGAVPFPARGLCPPSDDAGRPPSRRRGVAPDARPQRRRADPVDARAACLRTDAGAEEADRLSGAGEIGRRRQRYVTALLAQFGSPGRRSDRLVRWFRLLRSAAGRAEMIVGALN